MDDDPIVSDPPPLRPDVGEIRQRYPKAYDRWTPEADAQLLDAYRAGRDIDELADDFRRQPSAIESRLKKVAFDLLRQQRPNASGSTVE